MSLPDFSTQAELFSTAGLSSSLFAPTDRYRLFAKLVYPRLVAARATLEKCYCADNGRVALEPVLMTGVSILQYLDGTPDRQAVEMLRYHAGWNFALNRQLGDALFHPSSLVNFRNRLVEHQQCALGFTIIWDALEEAGLVSKKSRQRLDSTQMMGLVARMSRLDCVRESLRLALQELEKDLAPEARPRFWVGLWERYVESQTDYRAGSETLARKLVESGVDAWQLLEWLRGSEREQWAQGPQARLLARVFAEQFEMPTRTTSAVPREEIAVAASDTPTLSEALETGAPAESVQPEAGPTPVQAVTDLETPAPKAQEATVAVVIEPLPSAPQATPEPKVNALGTGQPRQDPPRGQAPVRGPMIEPRDKRELDSDRVQNPHDPDATYAVKGKGEKKKEHVGYKVQVAETVCEVELAPGEPTRNFITGMVTHPAYQSDEAGAVLMTKEQAAMGLDQPPTQYVDGAYISAQELAAAKAQGRELIGPAPGVPDNNQGRLSTEEFDVNVQRRTALCPAGHPSTQCSRLEEGERGKVSFRFEWSTHCAECPLRPQCVGPTQKHRTILVGEHHSELQARRREQKTAAFKQRMKHRNAIEGTQSELVRGHGLRHARYRGLTKTKLQNYFLGAACNVKRWIRREAWRLQQRVADAAAQTAAPAGA
jgi:hypothetical protein